jgi:hypothetical protein
MHGTTAQQLDMLRLPCVHANRCVGGEHYRAIGTSYRNHLCCITLVLYNPTVGVRARRRDGVLHQQYAIMLSRVALFITMTQIQLVQQIAEEKGEGERWRGGEGRGGEGEGGILNR